MSDIGYFKDKSGPSGIDATQRKPYERLTAIKSAIKEINNGDYYKLEGWDPNYILSPYGRQLSRVNVIGVLTQKNMTEDMELQGINVDDGTGSVMLRTFESMSIFSGLEVGDVIQIIGKPREFNQTRYIVPEIITKVSKDWLILRKLELERDLGADFQNTPSKINITQPPQREETPTPTVDNTTKNEDTSATNVFDRIMSHIKENDAGDGIDIEDIKESINIPGCEEKIQELLKLGEIFEVRPGRVKVL